MRGVHGAQGYHSRVNSRSMRLLTYAAKKKGAAPRVGVMSGPEHLVEVKVRGHDFAHRVGQGRASEGKKCPEERARTFPLSSVRVLAPIPRPRKNVFCVGWNYVEHFEEGAKARTHTSASCPRTRPSSPRRRPTVNGPYDRIPLHAGRDREARLGSGAGRDHRPRRHQHHGSRRDEARVRLHGDQRRLGARDPAPPRPAVVQGQEPGRPLPDGAVDRHRRQGEDPGGTCAW